VRRPALPSPPLPILLVVVVGLVLGRFLGLARRRPPEKRPRTTTTTKDETIGQGRGIKFNPADIPLSSGAFMLFTATDRVGECPLSITGKTPTKRIYHDRHDQDSEID
jgi:hypothetical protein